jgi:hypothetical protein
VDDRQTLEVGGDELSEDDFSGAMAEKVCNDEDERNKKYGRLYKICEGVFRLDVHEAPLSMPWESSFSPCEQNYGGQQESEFTRQKQMSDQGSQVDIREKNIVSKLKLENFNLKQRLSLLEGEKSLASKAEEGYQWFTSSPAKFYFYTGLSRDAFEVLLRFLGDEAESLQTWGSESRGVKIHSRFQLAMTLTRFRQASTHIDISYRFKIGATTVGNVFITWVQFLYVKFSALREKMFCPRSNHKPPPKSFRNPLLRDVRVVIDCTEFYIESSGDFKQQGNLYSSYKSRPTAKVLIGVSPCGAAMFVSEVFEGAISDREIVKQSGFVEYLKEGDIVLADRGFTIEDLLVEKGAKLVIPPFLGGRKVYSNEELIRTKLIAKARIHVERFNERIKNYRVLSGVLPHYLVPLLSQIVFVLCCLVNFQEPLAQ